MIKKKLQEHNEK